MHTGNDPEYDAKLRRSEDLREEALKSIDHAREYQSALDAGRAQMEISRAWQTLEEALRICPSNHRARFLLVSCAMNADDYSRAKEEALQIYRELSGDALKRMNDSVLHLSIAHASKMSGDYESAARFAREATQLYPTDPQPHMILGEVRQTQGRSEEAEQRCFRALKLHQSPDCSHRLTDQNVYFTLCVLGAAQIDLGKAEEAEPNLLKATQLSGHSSILALRHLTNAYRILGRSEDALRTAQRAVQKDPTDEDARRDLAELESTVKLSTAAPPMSTRWRHPAAAPMSSNHRNTQRSVTIQPPMPSATDGYAVPSSGLAPGVDGSNTYRSMTIASARREERNCDTNCDRNPADNDWFGWCCVDRSQEGEHR